MINIELMEMYGDLGDRIAVQYGGSEAHNKMAGASASSNAAATNTSASGSTSKQGELLTSIKRYYSNAFTDMMKQVRWHFHLYSHALCAR